MIESLLLALAALATIFGWAFFSFWSAIPAGIALNVAPVLVAATVTLSYASGVALVLLVGAPIRERIRRRMLRHDDADSEARPNRMVQRVQAAWERYGMVGLALLAPMTVGAQIGAVIGLSFGARPLRLLLAMTLGAAAWALLITLAAVLGLLTLTGQML